MDQVVPVAVKRLLTADVAAEIASAFSGQPVYPEHVVVDGPGSAAFGLERSFPGWPGPVLVLSYENQGVCSWGVPVDGGDHCPVLVGGDLLDDGKTTVEYAASVADFIAAWRWDLRCLTAGPVLQAQAAELARSELGYLRARLSPATETAGWPGSRQYRFEGQGVQVLLWSQRGQCDWWISAVSEESLRAFAAGLLDLPGLRDTLWSNDEAGTRLLSGLFDESRR